MEDNDLGIWIEVDAEKKIFGRKTDKYIFEFIEGDVDDTNKKYMKIDLSKYAIDRIEDIINAFGLTLLPIYEETLENIYYTYEEDSDFTIAECIFKTEME